MPADGGLRPEFFRQCEMVAEAIEGPMTGYAVVAWNARGTITTQFQVSGPPYHQAQVPALARDVLRRHDVHEIAG